MTMPDRRANALPPADSPGARRTRQNAARRGRCGCEKSAIVVIYVQRRPLRMTMTRPMRTILMAALLLSAACTSAPTGPTPSNLTPSTNVFSATLSPGGKIFYTPILSEASDVTMTVISVTAPGSTVALQTRIGMGYGTPDETDPANTCNL